MSWEKYIFLTLAFNNSLTVQHVLNKQQDTILMVNFREDYNNVILYSLIELLKG